MKSQEELVRFLKHEHVLKDQEVIEAFMEVDRAHFVPKDKLESAYINEPLSIGLGQTISQPYTVAFMLDLLEAKKGDKVLEIGYGSAWQTAMLAHIVGPSGHVYAMEIVKSLCNFGKKNIANYPTLSDRVSLFCKSGKGGLPDVARKIGGFDRIIAAAAAKELPTALRENLKVGGVVVYPNSHSIVREERTSDGWRMREFPGFVFVPFVMSQ